MNKKTKSQNKKEETIDVSLLLDMFSEVATAHHLPVEEVQNIFESTFKRSYESQDPDADIHFTIDVDNNVFEIVNKNAIVVDWDKSEISSDIKYSFITLEDAKEINPAYELDDKIVLSMLVNTPPQFIRKVFSTMVQQIREHRKELIYNDHHHLVDTEIEVEVVAGNRNAIVKLSNGTRAILPQKLANPNIHLSVGDKISVYVVEVKKEASDNQIIVSNGSKHLVVKIIKESIPEVAEGIVEIVASSRLAGVRTKIAVKSNDENVEPRGAVIGKGGERIKEIIQNKLKGEKIDVIKWTDDENQLLLDAIAPSKVIAIFNKKDENGDIIEGTKVIVTPKKHQTLAIGKKGHNARLAVELVGKRLDIISPEEAEALGYTYEPNGNTTPEMLAAIEDGTFTNRPQRRNPRQSFGNFKRNDSQSFSYNFMSDDINKFNEEMETTEFTIDSYDEPSFNLSEDDFEKYNNSLNTDDTMSYNEINNFTSNIEDQNSSDDISDFDFDENDIDPDFL